MKLIGYAAALAAAAAPAIAEQSPESFPSRPVRLIVPFTSGGAVDLLARRIAPKMSESWGQQVVVDSRPGGGGTLGSSIVAKATPDGYTLMVSSISYAMAAALYSKLPFDPAKDLTGVSQISVSTSLLVVAPSLGVKTVKDLIALAKKRPGQLNYGSNGVGAGMHLNAEQFRFAAGIDVVHVPYKGVPEVLVDIMVTLGSGEHPTPHGGPARCADDRAGCLAGLRVPIVVRRVRTRRDAKADR
jgi:tripartite-type tricarboxylate transporter receptor subunit TctC